jgi:hypothetical protein
MRPTNAPKVLLQHFVNLIRVTDVFLWEWWRCLHNSIKFKRLYHFIIYWASASVWIMV